MTPEKILTHYERGRLTSLEAIGKLCLLATEYEPATYAALMPTEWLDSLREETTRIPKPEEILFLRSVCRSGPFDAEQWKAERQAEIERYIAGLRTWKAYFDTQKTQG